MNKLERREFLSLLAMGTASTVLIEFSDSAVLAQQTLPNPAEWLHAGPMLGRSEMTETEIWLQTKRACRAEVRFWKQGKPETARLSETIRTTEEGDFIARFKLSRLEFGTFYDYEIYLDGQRVPLASNPGFQSQKMWRWRLKKDEEIPAFKIAFGSCAYINDKDYDRPGNPYGGDYEIFESIAEQNPMRCCGLATIFTTVKRIGSMKQRCVFVMLTDVLCRKCRNFLLPPTTMQFGMIMISDPMIRIKHIE